MSLKDHHDSHNSASNEEDDDDDDESLDGLNIDKGKLTSKIHMCLDEDI